jgi:hypothetical protein
VPRAGGFKARWWTLLVLCLSLVIITLFARAPRGLPAAALHARRASIGAAMQAGRQVGGRAGGQLVDAARYAFIHGADVTSMA